MPPVPSSRISATGRTYTAQNDALLPHLRKKTFVSATIRINYQPYGEVYEERTSEQATSARTSEREKGGTMKNAAKNPDDSLSTQMRNTKAQVTGTWKKLSSTFQQAGKKVTSAVAGVKNKVSSKKTG